MKYDDKMDIECIPLCDALNTIEGIETIDSCCGHNKSSFHIFFYLKDLTKVKNLIVIGRIFDRRYGGIEGWTCELSNTDTPEHLPMFLITSNTIRGQQAYDDANDIALNIHEHLNHPEFKRIFNL